jgi:hypothetical protein
MISSPYFSLFNCVLVVEFFLGMILHCEHSAVNGDRVELEHTPRLPTQLFTNRTGGVRNDYTAYEYVI